MPGLLGGAALLAAVTIFALWLTTREGLSGDGESRAITAVAVWVGDAWPALAWALAAWGWGYWTCRVLRVREAASGFAQMAIGIALLLWLDHFVGWMGWMQRVGNATAWALLFPGVAALAHTVWRRRGEEMVSTGALHGVRLGWVIAGAIALPVVLGLVAATSAPGWLWESEHGGFDVLEYHLQLPKEWMQSGRIEPLNHNVYSYLPSYGEAAYYHLAALWEPFAGGTHPAIRAANSCQLLHVFMMLIAGWGVATLVLQRLKGPATGADEEAGRGWIWGAALAGGLYIALPWNIVTGTMAYNEQFVNVLMVGATCIAWPAEQADSRSRSGPWMRGAMAGLLAGCACSAKMTAVGTVVIPIGLALLEKGSVRGRATTLAGYGVGGVAACAPWLIRNWQASGNPVFPMGSEYFGAGHWTAEQVERFAGSHAPRMGFPECLEEFMSKGLLDLQWGGLWWLGAVALACVFIATRASRTRKSVMEGSTGHALRLAGMLVIHVVFWMALTHQQSRFLVTSAAPLTALGGLAVGSMWAFSRRPRKVLGPVCVVATLGMGICSEQIYEFQRQGAPARMLDGLDLRSGLAAQELGGEAGESLRASFVDVYLNLDDRAREGLVYLLGDSTPFYLQVPALYHTTYDASPLGDLMRQFPGDRGAWAAGLKASGVTHVLVDYTELVRLCTEFHWYDPAVTPEGVAGFMQDYGRVIKGWPEDAPVIVLFEWK